MTSRHLRSVALASVAGVVALHLLLPGVALADNCSYLSDCWSTAAGAASAALGAAVGALGGLFGGLGLGGDDEDGSDGEGSGGGDERSPENEDSPDPRPC